MAIARITHLASPLLHAKNAGMNGDGPFLLHSSAAAGGEWSRWSYEAGAARLLLRCDREGLGATLSDGSGVIRRWEDPLAALAWMAESMRGPVADGPPFKGGWIGWLSYDLGRLFEMLPAVATDDLKLPLFEFTFHDQVLARDEMSGVEQVLCSPAPVEGKPIRFKDTIEHSDRPLESTFSRAAYKAAVARAIDYIAAGDIFQVNLSQRFSIGLRERPIQIARRLREQSPAWFGAYLDYGDHALISGSPELFLRVTPQRDGKRRVVTRPIKGTRPRQAGMEQQLRQSIKDQAELNMIVDLERNDLGRVCEIGSVKVTETRSIEAHPTVYHGVATVEGVLREDVGFVDLLRATFPGGSITGAPKIRAMQIVEELEPVRRGPYCGAIGYLSADGNMQFNIAIRTMIAHAGRIHIPVGGGIVADSTPSEEYEETLVKARAMFRAVGVGAK